VRRRGPHQRAWRALNVVDTVEAVVYGRPVTQERTATSVFALGALYGLEEALTRATRAAVSGYRAIAGGAPRAAELQAATAATPGERALAILTARMGGVAAAVSRERVMRLAAEDLLGGALFEAVTGRAAGDPATGCGLDEVTLRDGVEARLTGERPALVARLPLPAVLYLLARDGLTDAFCQIVADRADSVDPPPLAALVAEVHERVGPLGPVVVAHSEDAAELAAAGWEVARARSVRWRGA